MKARDNYYEALMGTLPSQLLDGKTLLEAVFDKTGLLPVNMMQGLARTMSVNQAIISWAYMQTGQLSLRQADKSAWSEKMDNAWDKNNKAVFAIGSCKWTTDHSVKLSCDNTSPRPANVSWGGVQRPLREMCAPQGPNSMSIPTKGSDHPEWGFDVSCQKAATGIAGYSNIPNDHSVSYVTGFKLHCKDEPDTGETGHLLHDNDDIDWDVQLDPLLSVSGCVNVPHGHEITYWASADFTSVSGQTGSIVTKGDSCDSDALRYSLSCDKGYCMKRFQGYSDLPNGNHVISYIACLNIYCGICTDADDSEAFLV